MDMHIPQEPGGELRLAEEFEAYNINLNLRVEAALDAYSPILLDALHDFTPQKTGETAQAWEVFHSGVWELFITNSNEPVATFLSQGTSAHWVEPAIAKALHWVMDGVHFFSKGHMVSGIEPMNIEERALEATREDLIALMDQAESDAWDDAFERGVNVGPARSQESAVDLGGPESDDEGMGDEGGD